MGDRPYRRGALQDQLRDLSRRFEVQQSDYNRLLAERQLLLSELKSMRLEFEQAVRERTEEHQRARQVAEDADRAKSAFLAAMSHEIRTPMNGVMGMVDVLLETRLSAEQRDYLLTVKSSSVSLLGIINEILDFSKIEAGRLELDRADLSVAAIVEECCEVFAEAAFAKGVELLCWVDPNIPLIVQGDPGRLRQVLLNLLGNAVKFTDEGEVSVSVRLLEADRSGAAVQFEIRDSGIGMTQQQAARLFEPYVQVQDDQRRFGGTGLGLSISRRLVQLMGGQIAVESEPGQGSTFLFSALFGVDDHGWRVHQRMRELESRQLGGLRLLLWSASESTARLLRDIARAWGVRIHRARTWEEAESDRERAIRLGKPFAAALIDRATIDDERVLPLPSILLYHPGQLTGLTMQSGAGRTALIKPIKANALKSALLDLFDAGRSPVEPLSTAVSEGGGDHPSVAPRAPARILVAEDNPVNQKVIVKLLERHGHSVTVAANGRAALQRASDGGFDLILMDCLMPEVDGYEASRRLRARGIRTPIVALTANALSEDRERCLTAGMNDFLAKPIEVDLLDRALERWLSPTASVPSAPAPSTVE
jgi:two-component system sensor histidine kinase/response regulator